MKPELLHRVAQQTDVAQIIKLMQLAIEENMRQFLSAAEIAAARETMGVDQTLIDDGTYFVIEATADDGRTLVGCGGWGKRRTLYGGNNTLGRDDTLSDPKTEPARIRAMYTHPEWTRRGIGRLLLKLGEDAARKAGFKTIQLGSTVPGEPLYVACGYREIERAEHVAENGLTSTVITMEKRL